MTAAMAISYSRAPVKCSFSHKPDLPLAVAVQAWLPQCVPWTGHTEDPLLLQGPGGGDIPAGSEPRHPHNSDGSATLGPCEPGRGV